MSVEVKSNQITGITTTVNPTDAASKQYVDDNITSSGVPVPTTADETEFLFTNGSTASWEPIQASQEYTAVGTYTFTVPTQAKKFTIEATGAGGGGASGDFIASNYVSATLWRLRTAGNTTQINASIYKSSDSSYLFGGNSGLLNYSTNAIFWTLRTSGTTGSINALAPYFVDYIAGGASNTVMWTQRVPGFGTSFILTLMYDGTNYFAAGAGGVLNFSTNSIHWELRTSGRTTQIGYAAGGNGLLYAPGQTEPYVYAGASGVLASSTDSIAWTLRTSPNSTIAIQALAFGSLPTATYVRANATAGNIATSTNAIQWTLRTTGNITNIIQSLLYSTGPIGQTEYYINCRAAGALQTSTDAIRWISRTSGTASALHQLLYGGVYVVSGASGVINTSTNAIQWTLRTSGTAQALYGLGYTAGSYVASGVSGVSLYSTDAISWLARTSGFGSSTIQAVTFGNNIFINGGAGGTLTTAIPSVLSSSGLGAYFAVSTDTISWTLRTTNTNIETINSFAVGESNSLIAGFTDYNNITIDLIYSTDGIAWELRTSGFGSTTINTLLYANNLYVLGGNIFDSAQWTRQISGFGASTIFTLMYDGTNYFAAGAGGALTTSTDSINWTYRTSGRTTQIGYATGGNGLLYAAGQTNAYVYAGASGVLASSTDSIAWTLRTSPNSTIAIQALAFGSLPTATYVRANATAGNIATSTNAIQWTLRTTGNITNVIQALLYSEATTEYYINCRAAGVLQTSTNAIHWTARTSGTASALHQLLYGGVYVVSGASGVINTSTNAIEWTLRTSGTASALYGLSYTSGSYVASGVSGVSLYSTDAISWILRTSGFGTSTIQAVTFGNNIFVNGGVGGTLTTATPTSLPLQGQGLLTSTNAVEWSLRTSNFSTSPVFTSIYVGTSYLIAGGGGNLATSPDGITWTSRTSGFGTTTIRALSYSNSTYVINGDSGKIASSTDAITWIIRTSNTTQNLFTGVGIGITFLTAGAAGAVSHSPAILGAGGAGGGGGVSVTWELDKSQITGSTFTVNVGSGGTSNTAGAGTTVSWDGPAGTYSITATGGNPGGAYAGGTGGNVNLNTNYLRETDGGVGGQATLLGATTPSAGTNATLAYQTTGGGAGRLNEDATGGALGAVGGTINYYNNTLAGITPIDLRSPANNALQVPGLSYGGGGTGGAAQVGPGVIWTARTGGIGATVPNYTVFYVNGQYLSGGGIKDSATTGGLIRSSTNGIFWISRTSGTLNIVGFYAGGNGFAYGDSLYLASGGSINGSGYFLATSSDSIIWTLRTTGHNTSTTITSITSLDTKTEKYLLSAGDEFSTSTNGQLVSSTNGIHWSLRTSGTVNGITSVGNNGTDYFASGHRTTITWTQRTTTQDGSTFLASVYDGTHYYIAGSFGDLRVSTDTIHWFARTSGSGGTIGADGGGNGLLYAPGQTFPYVYCGSGSGTSPLLASSTDGIRWTLRTTGTPSNANLNAVIFADLPTPIYLTGSQTSTGTDTSLAVSTDTINWTLRTTGFNGTNGNTRINSILYTSLGITPYVTVGGGKMTQTSTDSIIWTTRTNPSSGGSASAVYSKVIYGDGIYVVCGDTTSGFNSLINTSTNAIHWTARTTGATSPIYDVVYGNGIYVASGFNGVSAYSTNAIVWQLRTSGFGTTIINTITFGNGIFVNAGRSATITTSTSTTLLNNGNGHYFALSTDAIHWSLRTTGGGTQSVFNTIYANGRYVTSGSNYNNNHTISVSTDSINWTLRTSAIPQTSPGVPLLYALAHASNTYFAAGTNGRIMTSTDSIIWAIRTIALATHHALSASPNDIVSAASGGVVVQAYLAAGATGGSGTRGGGGGGGGYDAVTNSSGDGGTGGNGYVRISWV